MRRVLTGAVAILALTVAVTTAVAGNGDRPSPKPKIDKQARELAAHCVLSVTRSGAYSDWDADTLGQFCIDVAKKVFTADWALDADTDDND